MPNEPQLLAHAGASSSRKDDNGFRSQLHAYMLLDSAQMSRAHHLSHVVTTEKDSAEHERHCPADEDFPDDGQHMQDSQLRDSTSQMELFSSQRPLSRPGSFLTKTRNVWSPKRGHGSQTFSAIPISTSRALVTANPANNQPAVQSQSSYLASPFVTSLSKKRKLVVETEGSTRTRERADPDGVQRGNLGPGPDARLYASPHRADNLISDELSSESNESTSELPTSYSISEGRSESERTPSGIVEGSTSSNATSGSLEKRQQVLDFMTSKAPITIERDFATMPREATCRENRGRPQLDSPVSASSIRLLQNLSREIDPPEPGVGYGQFQTHITKAFEQLASNAVIARSYTPRFVVRELRPLERGYWLVRCNVWPVQRQVDCWQFLEKVIKTGRLGWGVRCVRGIEPRNGSPDSAEPSKASHVTDAYSFGPIKVYCWGEVVRHVYLLLYTASESKVRRLGLQWLDAEGTVVVQMP